MEKTKNNQVKKYNIITLILILFISGLYFYQYEYMVSKMELTNQYLDLNDTYCEGCLIMEFYGGCGKYYRYYFENEYNLRNDLNKNELVNVRFRKHKTGIILIKGVWK